MPTTGWRRRQPHAAAAAAAATATATASPVAVPGFEAGARDSRPSSSSGAGQLQQTAPGGGGGGGTAERPEAAATRISKGWGGRGRAGAGGSSSGVGSGGRRRSFVTAFGAAAVSAAACVLLLCCGLLVLVPTPTTAAPAAGAAAGAAGGLSAGALSRAAAALQGAPVDPTALPVELNPSVMVLGEFDWVPYQVAPPYTSRCTDMVDRAKKVAGGSRVNFVPTHYWKDRDEDGSIDSFCYMDSTMTCLNHDGPSVASFRAGMELCFRRAVEEGLGVSLVPHLDDGGKTAAWRNGLVFNPNKAYGGLSYAQVMLEPLVDALAAALAAKPDWVQPLPVWMALQGEMSATVLRYPHEYTQLLSELKERLLRRMRAAGASEAYVAAQRELTQVGVSFNFNKVLQVNTGGGAGGGSAASVLSRFLGFGPFAAATSSLTAFMGRGLLAASQLLPQRADGSSSSGGVSSGSSSSGGLQAIRRQPEESSKAALVAAEGAAPGAATTHGHDHRHDGKEHDGNKHDGKEAKEVGQAKSAEAAARAVTPHRIQAAASSAAAGSQDLHAAAPRRRRDLLQAAAAKPAAVVPTTAAAAAAAAASSTAPGPGSSAGKIDILALGALFEAIDFLGISAYAALDDPDFPMTALQNAAFTYFGEMRDQVGLDVSAILKRRNLDLHYSEFGLGGGNSPLGTTPARTPEAAARMPFYGVWGAYAGPATDPWAPPQMRAFLHSFFAKTLSWLAVGGGPTYKISHCFLWGMGSWDVLGIYPESTTPSGSFRDPQLVQAVTAHNTRAVALAPPRSSSTPAAAKAAAAPTPPAAMQAYSDNTQQAGK
ncbi:hypothetical protein CHLRE_13g607400v5 [Chlamydomonas reinhardtii]|uniref:Uncharacterized protein n=1 Tax=Chlamydomonas reinhardtii TaxID=3055 RepID=A0A2K3D1L7_CHLRE|nr:uncharacterized protein CHLRE_13g607400v5 [Chlamydomonas reinhardtii]PNW74409.1 hypothetical protein CHLRE_13g607400v5 [Chlamydomonas reinhardtii]